MAGALILLGTGRCPEKDCEFPPAKESELKVGVPGKGGNGGLPPVGAPAGGNPDLFTSTPRQPSSRLCPGPRPGGAANGGVIGAFKLGGFVIGGFVIGEFGEGVSVGAF